MFKIIVCMKIVIDPEMPALVTFSSEAGESGKAPEGAHQALILTEGMPLYEGRNR